jgi:hypothetical protein
MGVSVEVRKVEDEIDERVRTMPLWRCAREPVIRAALDYYRGVAEIFMLRSRGQPCRRTTSGVG